MDRYLTKKLTVFQVITLVSSLIGLILTFYVVYSRLRFYYGVDYHMYYTWQKTWMKTGVFYPENTVFFNFPLAVAAFGFYGFLPIGAAVLCKFVQTSLLTVYCVWLLIRMRPDLFRDNGMARFSLAWVLVTFVSTQWYYLNIYVEVACCLLLSLYYHDKENTWVSAFFLSLALVFKVFLMPLVLAPLMTRQYRLFFRVMICLGCLSLISVLIFGVHTHVDMLRAMAATYAKMRIHGIGFPVVSDGFAGWQDVFNKLVRLELISGNMVAPLTLTLALLYGCLFCYVLYLMAFRAETQLNNKAFYANVLASLVILSLGFNFRFDHGVLLLAGVFFFSSTDHVQRRQLTAIFFVLSLSRFMVTQGLNALGFETMARMVSSVGYVVTFQFIGINLLVMFVAAYWAGLKRT